MHGDTCSACKHGWPCARCNTYIPPPLMTFASHAPKVVHNDMDPTLIISLLNSTSMPPFQYHILGCILPFFIHLHYPTPIIFPFPSQAPTMAIYHEYKVQDIKDKGLENNTKAHIYIYI